MPVRREASTALRLPGSEIYILVSPVPWLTGADLVARKERITQKVREVTGCTEKLIWWGGSAMKMMTSFCYNII